MEQTKQPTDILSLASEDWPRGVFKRTKIRKRNILGEKQNAVKVIMIKNTATKENGGEQLEKALPVIRRLREKVKFEPGKIIIIKKHRKH